MTDEELTGMAVLIHPRLPDDPAGKQGEIGMITAANIAADLVKVKFDDDRRGIYGMDALLIFLSPAQIYDNIKQEIMSLNPATFKDVKNIALLLDYGSPGQQRTAMEIAQKNHGVMAVAMTSLEESLGNNQARKRGR